MKLRNTFKASILIILSHSSMALTKVIVVLSGFHQVLVCDSNLANCTTYSVSAPSLNQIVAKPEYVANMGNSFYLAAKYENKTGAMIDCVLNNTTSRFSCAYTTPKLPNASYPAFAFNSKGNHFFASDSKYIYKWTDSSYTRLLTLSGIKDMSSNFQHDYLYLLQSGNILTYNDTGATLIDTNRDLAGENIAAFTFNNYNDNLYLSLNDGVYRNSTSNGFPASVITRITTYGKDAKYLTTNQTDLYAQTEQNIVHINLNDNATHTLTSIAGHSISDIEAIAAYEENAE